MVITLTFCSDLDYANSEFIDCIFNLLTSPVHIFVSDVAP